MIRFATIGTNFVTDWLAEAARQVEGLEYAAVHSRSEETALSFAAKYGVKKVYTDLEELARDREIDAVYIASPNNMHYSQACLLMAWGKHILCEKTIASNSRELQEMIRVSREHQVVLVEAVKHIFTPAFQAIRDNLCKLGKLRYAEFSYCQYSSRYQRYQAGQVEHVFDPAYSAGALMDLGTYCVHPMVSLFGAPEKVLADAVMLRGEIDGLGTILADYGDMRAHVLYSKITNSTVPSQIQGEKGCMVIDRIYWPGRVVIEYCDGKSEVVHEADPRDIMCYELEHWLHMIRGAEDVQPFLQESVWKLEVMDEVRRQIGLRFPADEM